MIKLMRAHPLGQLTWLFAAFTFGSFFNYLFHAVSGRLLGAEVYGVIAAFIGLQLTLSAPFGVMQAIISDFTTGNIVAGQTGRVKSASRHLWAASGASFLPLMIAIIVIRPWLNEVLGTSAPGMAIALALVLTSTIASPIGYGFLQGAKSYGWMGAFRILSGVLRFAVAFALITLGAGLSGAIIGITSSSLLVGLLLIGLIEYRYRQVPVSKDVNLRTVFQHFGFFAFAALTGAVLINSDVILARWLFEPEAAGQYNAVATIGGILLFFILPLNIFLFPSLNERHLRGDIQLPSLAVPTAFVLVVGSIFALVCTVTPRLIIQAMYGSGYLAAGPWLGLYAFSRLGFAIAALHNTLYVSQHRWQYVLFKGVAALALLILMGGLFPTPEGFLAANVGVGWGLVILGEILFGGIIPRHAEQRQRLWQQVTTITFLAVHPRAWKGLLARVRLVSSSQLVLQQTGLPGLMAFLDEASIGQPSSDQAFRLNDLVARAVPLSGMRYCMRRSVLHYVTLREAGSRPRFVVGVERPNQDTLAGHSWIELEGEAFREEDDQHRRMTVMFSYPAQTRVAGEPQAPADRPA